MTFGEAVSFCLTKGYAKFEGRASRSEFWWFELFKTIFIIFCVTIVAAAIKILDSKFFVVIPLIALLGIFLPSLAVQVRRLHDLNRSGWWLILLPCLGIIPYVGIIVIVIFEIIYMLKGTQGVNRFGEDSQKF